MNTRASSCTYVGRLEAGRQAVYVVDAIGVERLRAPEGGFGWGEDSIGDTPLLARTLLRHVSGQDPAVDACGRFAAQILVRLPHDGFALQSDTIDAWLRRTVTV